jgi:hypothetical protein
MQSTFDNAALLLRIWDHFILFGWKGIFKASICLLKEYEDVLLGMPFEVMLTQIVNLPVKYLITKGGPEDETKILEKFDKTMKQLKIPTMLLERLKREFDMNYKLSGAISKS